MTQYCSFSLIGIILVCLLRWADSTEQRNGTIDEKCHPIPKYRNNQYIVGYGSLMKNASKARTYPNTGESIPVIVNGFSRRWNGQVQKYATTFLGVNEVPDSSFNGIVFQLPIQENVQQSLKDLDDREDLYCRAAVPFKNLQFFEGKPTTELNGDYWIYVNKPEYTARPNTQYPIVQSYVDTFLSGCLEIEDKFEILGFADACVVSTEGWNKYWVNDRIYPRRPGIYEKKAGKIDRILAAKVPEAYNAIKIEG